MSDPTAYESLSKNELIKLLVERDSRTEANPHRKKYGLIWEDKPEQFEADSIGRIPVLRKDPEKSIQADPAKPTHVLIQGDNYHALKVLTYTHERSVDVIYIDPPYNTGNKDFRYNDRYVDKEDGYRHSKWLSFMAKRLRLAKLLLKDTGVLLISIDDNEFAGLRLLADEIFGESNFISPLVWNGGRKNNARFLSNGHEYMLVYAKSVTSLIQRDVRWTKRKAGVDETVRKAIQLRETCPDDAAASKELRTWLRAQPFNEGVRRFCLVDEHVATKGPFHADGDLSAPGGGGAKYEVLHPDTGLPCKRPASGWRLTRESFDLLDAAKGVSYGPDHTTVPRAKRYLLEYANEVVETVFEKERQAAAQQLAEIVGKGKFPYPKDPEVIAWLVGLVSNSSAVVLDFFAGSGTTAHAVMQLNSEDGGSRQCILVTNDEGEFKDESGEALAGGICTHVTYPRVRKIIKGYTTPAGKDVPGFGENLAFLHTEFVEDRAIERYRRELSQRSADMLCLRESCFIQEKSGDKRWSTFTDGRGKRLVLVSDPYAAEDLRPLLKADKRETVLYTFRFGDDDDPAREYGGKGLEHVTAKPVPDSLLALHRRLAKQEAAR